MVLIINKGETDIKLAWEAFNYVIPAGEAREIPGTVATAILKRFPEALVHTQLKISVDAPEIENSEEATGWNEEPSEKSDFVGPEIDEKKAKAKKRKKNQ